MYSSEPLWWDHSSFTLKVRCFPSSVTLLTLFPNWKVLTHLLPYSKCTVVQISLLPRSLHWFSQVKALLPLPSSYSRDPQPPGRGPVPTCGLLGTGPHSRRWAAGERVKLHLPLTIARLPPEPSPPPPPTPGPWKNCLPQNQSLVPKRLGTAVL